jgi:hypothetical protein
MIAVERIPADESWIDLCGHEGIALVWHYPMLRTSVGRTPSEAPAKDLRSRLVTGPQRAERRKRKLRLRVAS